MTAYADVALSQQMMLWRHFKVVSGNLANLKTPGFQAKALIPQELPVKPSFQKDYSFVEDLVDVRDLRQGRFVETGNPLHAYIVGRAYFGVQTPSGVRYTRSGAFTLNNLNELVTPDGYQILNQGNAPIVLPEGVTEIMIGADGAISSPEGFIDQLGLFSFANEQLLSDVGDNLLMSSEAATPADKYNITQFGFEGANTNEVVEMTRMMDIMRSFQQIQKFIEQDGQLQSRATQSLLKVSTFA